LSFFPRNRGLQQSPPHQPLRVFAWPNGHPTMRPELSPCIEWDLGLPASPLHTCDQERYRYHTPPGVMVTVLGEE